MLTMHRYSDAGSNHICRCHSRTAQQNRTAERTAERIANAQQNALQSQMILDNPRHHRTNNMCRRAHSPPRHASSITPSLANVHRQTTAMTPATHFAYSTDFDRWAGWREEIDRSPVSTTTGQRTGVVVVVTGKVTSTSDWSFLLSGV